MSTAFLTPASPPTCSVDDLEPDELVEPSDDEKTDQEPGASPVAEAPPQVPGTNRRRDQRESAEQNHRVGREGGTEMACARGGQGRRASAEWARQTGQAPHRAQHSRVMDGQGVRERYAPGGQQGGPQHDGARPAAQPAESPLHRKLRLHIASHAWDTRGQAMVLYR